MTAPSLSPTHLSDGHSRERGPGTLRGMAALAPSPERHHGSERCAWESASAPRVCVRVCVCGPPLLPHAWRSSTRGRRARPPPSWKRASEQASSPLQNHEHTPPLGSGIGNAKYILVFHIRAYSHMFLYSHLVCTKYSLRNSQYIPRLRRSLSQ